MQGLPTPITKQSRLGHFLEYAPEGTIYWNFDTFGEPIETKWNKGCYNVSKNKVHRCMESAFGYSQAIDPTTYDKPYIEKSNLQAKHDGKILTVNQEPRAGYVYEHFIDTRKDGHYTEFRLFIFNGVKFVMLKKKPANDLFGWKAVETMYFDVHDIFDNETIKRINKFCEVFGLDLGEIDALLSDKLYLIDVNNMAGGTDDNGIFRICINKDYDFLFNLYAKHLSELR